MAAASSSMSASAAADLARRIDASILTEVPDLVMEQNEVDEMDESDLPTDTVNNLVEVVMNRDPAPPSSRNLEVWASALAQRINALGMNLWKQDFPSPERHRDYYTNSRDLPEFWGIAPGEMRPEHQPDIHRRWKKAMLIIHPDKHPGATVDELTWLRNYHHILQAAKESYDRYMEAMRQGQVRPARGARGIYFQETPYNFQKWVYDMAVGDIENGRRQGAVHSFLQTSDLLHSQWMGS